MSIDSSNREVLPFSTMNETDVRAEVLEPLLRRLGYAMRGAALIRREHPLSYPHLYLGRKKPGKDLTLRGIADFTLEVAGHARWTLEAKTPSAVLDDEVVQQAWSYAIHPEVQSSYFAICNGALFQLFSTFAAWGQGPLLELTYAELDSRFDELRAFLGPAELARRHPNHLLSAGKPLGPAMRAFARVTSGTISYQRSSMPIPLLTQMQVSIVDGTLRRDSTGRMIAQLHTKGPFREVQEKIAALGLDIQEYLGEGECLSVSAEQPTTFHFDDEQAVPVMMHPTTFKPMATPVPMHVRIEARAIGHLDGDTFKGRFLTEMTFSAAGTSPVTVTGEGTFELRLL